MTLKEKFKNHSQTELVAAYRSASDVYNHYANKHTGGGKLTEAETAEAHEAMRERDYLSGKVDATNTPTPPAGAAGLEIGAAAAEYTNTPRLIRPGENKTYGRIFNTGGNTDTGGFDSIGQFMRAVWTGNDPRLHALQGPRAGMSEGIPSEGGFFVPETFAAPILTNVIEKSVMLKNGIIRPMLNPSEKFPAFEIGDHSANLYGGIVGYWAAEEGTITESAPKSRMIKLEAAKLTELVIPSGELTDDVPDFDALISDAMSKALEWFLDYALLRGTGAGQPLGLLNSTCKISVAKESGQGADTVVYQNLKKMYARNQSRTRATWIINDNLLPELMEITIPVGTGGSFVPLLKEADGTMTIFGRPVIFTEKMPTLGDEDDIIFADLSQYLIGLLRGIQVAKSIHVHFTTHRTAYRMIVRADGQHIWNDALTKKSADTVSPVVGLSERA